MHASAARRPTLIIAALAIALVAIVVAALATAGHHAAPVLELMHYHGRHLAHTIAMHFHGRMHFYG